MRQVMIIFLCLLLSHGSAFSQTVNKVYTDGEGNNGTSILALPDGYLLIGSGISEKFRANTVKVIKTDLYGDTIHKTEYGKNNEDNSAGYTGSLIQRKRDQVIIQFGTEWPFNGIRNGMIYWFDNNGDTIRTKRIKSRGVDHWLWQGIETGNGDLLGVGHASNHQYPNWQAWLVRTDSLGNVKWHQSYGGSSTEDLRVIIPAYDGGYLLAGTTWSYGDGPENAYLVKVDTAGNLQWERTYGNSFSEAFFRIMPSADGNYYIWWVAEDDDMSNGAPSYEKRAYLGKIDTAGDTLWTKMIHQEYSDWVYMHQIKEVDEGRSLIVVGQKDDPSTGVSSGWVAKMDSSANLIWERFYVNPDNSNFGGSLFDFQVTDNGHIACVGRGNTPGTVFANQQDIWLLVVDSMGCLVPSCDTIIGIPETPLSNIHIYPNPATDQLYISLPDNTPTAQLELYSLLGAKLLQTQVHHQTPIDISQLPKGMYVYRLRVGSSTHNGKLLIE